VWPEDRGILGQWSIGINYIRILNIYRPFRRTSLSDAGSQPGAKERYREPAELAGWHWLSGQSRNKIPHVSSRAGFLNSSMRQCTGAARSLGRGQAHTILSGVSKCMHICDDYIRLIIRTEPFSRHLHGYKRVHLFRTPD
jgi:hypothetical protein